jgi:hypothetical protein
MFFEEGKREFFEPVGGDSMQFDDMAICFQKLQHVVGTDFLGEEAETDFELLDVVEFEGEAATAYEVDRVALLGGGIGELGGVAHFVGVTLGVEGFGPDPGHGGICLWRQRIGRGKRHRRPEADGYHGRRQAELILRQAQDDGRKTAAAGDSGGYH